MKPGVPLGAVLALACGAQLMVVLDGLVVNVALPQLQRDLDMSTSALQWVVNGYLVTFGGLLLLAARVSDLIGHRRIFLAGVAVFSLAGLAGGLAHDPAVLIGARVLQGAGAAALAPSSLSLLTATHTGNNRVRALTIWSATSSSAGALGLVLGGAITDLAGWRWVLLINVPIGVLLWTLAAATLAPAHRHQKPTLDIPGAITVTLATGALTLGISQSGTRGWTSGHVVALMTAGVALLILFVVAEQHSPHPLVPLTILRRRNVVMANSIIATVGAIMTATMYFLSLYLQQALGNSPLQTGLALLPMSAVLILGAFTSKSLLPKVGVRRLLAAGGLLMTSGLTWLAAITTHSIDVMHILGPTLLWAAGASIIIMPCLALATSGIEPEHGGLASGLINTARSTGGAIGLAAMVTVTSTVTAHSTAPLNSEHLVQGYSTAFIGAAIAAGVVTILSIAVRRDRSPALRPQS